MLLRLLLFAAETFKENLEDIVELLRDVGKAQRGKFWRPIAQCRLHPFDPAPLRRHPHLSVMSARAVGQHFYLEEPWLLRHDALRSERRVLTVAALSNQTLHTPTSGWQVGRLRATREVSKACGSPCR